MQINANLLDTMCTDLAVFGKFFTLPPNSSYTLDLAQMSMCALNPNVTALFIEMSNSIDGFSEFITLVRIIYLTSGMLDVGMKSR